ncbi:group 1 family glycosyl transferase [Alteromonas naphthalenivorans]|uniref:Group 1 family glycosyl transferase n=2 Tax=Alteromonas naphthalenivorans TaxID=715451 RepID=F5ZAR8_ALTNA|nr:group 1 family glycosyl transferase [Alteromonas naphthalenivorans]
MKREILFFTNLHPLPWQSTRATYNREETRHLAEHANITLLIPVPWFTWIKEVLINGHRGEPNMCLFPFFYIPKVLSFLHPFFMLLSVALSIKPLYLFFRAKNVIASWAYAEGVCAAVLKRIFRFKLIIECLGSDVNVLINKPIHKTQMRWAFGISDTVTTKSYALAKEVNKHAPLAKLEVVYNGVDFDTFSLRSIPLFRGHSLNLLFIGSIIPTKGVFELVEGIAALKDKHSISLSIIGSGHSTALLRDKIMQLDMQASISLTGAVPHNELPQHLQNVDALLLPSYREGVPNVIMESLATGTPVVATRVGGIPEVVSSTLNGVFIEELSAEGVATAIDTLIKKDWQPAQIRQSIQKYTWENTALQLIDLLDK